jgi:hypothetical protein
VRHGWVVPAPYRPLDRAALRAAFAAAEPILFPGALAAALPLHRADVARTLRWFGRLRRGASAQDGIWERLRNQRGFVPGGAVVDQGDRREIEKVYAHARRGARVVARDLWAKTSWIADDERDLSLRMRFSFGAEQLLEWLGAPARARWADRFAEAVFPECRALAGAPRLGAAIERLAGRRVRFSERIVYNNAPGGGAVFHHDAEPWQLGVLYGQLAGATAWLALPALELARAVAAHARARRLGGVPRRPRAVLAALGREDAPSLERLLNASPEFTRGLVERGACFVLRAGDALVLPNHGAERTCWHAVFALGARPSLAHSYGIFARRRSGSDAADGSPAGGDAGGPNGRRRARIASDSR